jgi:serpin B
MTPAFRAVLFFSFLPCATFGAGFDAATATNQVGLDVYRQLAKENPGANLVISPYSIESALALAYAGADATTRAEMTKALHFADDDAAVQLGFRELNSALDEIVRKSKARAEKFSEFDEKVDAIEWHIANRLFGQSGYAFREPFLTLMRDGYAAPFSSLDFRTTPEDARRAINDWVEEQTYRKIRNLIPADGVDSKTRLVLVNALYLKAPWDTPFEKSLTKPEPFHLRPDSERTVPTMQHAAFLGYVKEQGFTVVALPYVGRDLQFVIMLPDASTTVADVAKDLKADNFARWAKLGGRGPSTSIALHLPKFRTEGVTIALRQALEALGVKSAFDVPARSANFDRIAPRKPNDYLAVSNVFHRTFIAVDEEGTEAAAATAIETAYAGMVSMPSKPIAVHVDRPFLFAIQHRASGACLFLGRITDPR